MTRVDFQIPTPHRIALAAVCRPHLGLAAVLLLAALPAAPARAAALSISGTPARQVVAGTYYVFVPTASAASAGHTRTFSILNKPSWGYFNTATGALNGHPRTVATYPSILIRVSDGVSSAALPVFSVAVSPSPLRISGAPASTVSAGSPYSFTPTVTDSRTGGRRSFAISGKPRWASFSSSTGQLSGVPGSGDVGRYPNVSIEVMDGADSAVLPSFALTVQVGAGGPPVKDVVSISGTPATRVAAGAPYSFRPSVTDTAHKSVSFSVQNKPAWATFSIATGQLSGTPSKNQAGTYPGIVITASDGTSSSRLPSFSISVASAAATGQATLTWKNPTQNTNGTSLNNLAGVRLYYGPSASSLSQLVELSTSTTSYTASNLGSGTWYFGAVAYSSSGAQSSMSNVVAKTVQ